MTIHVSVEKARVSVKLGVVKKFLILVLLGATYVDRFIRLTHSAKRIIVAHLSPLILTIAVHEASIETKKKNTEARQKE